MTYQALGYYDQAIQRKLAAEVAQFAANKEFLKPINVADEIDSSFTTASSKVYSADEYIEQNEKAILSEKEQAILDNKELIKFLYAEQKEELAAIK